MDLALLERDIAKEIVREGVPIRGAEVRFLRKSICSSMDQFGALLGLTAPAILKWEREPQKRLHPTHEVAVRALMAEKLNIAIEGRFTVLKGQAATPSRLAIRVANVPPRDTERRVVAQAARLPEPLRIMTPPRPGHAGARNLQGGPGD